MTPETESRANHGLLKNCRSRLHVFHCVCTDTQWEVRDGFMAVFNAEAERIPQPMKLTLLRGGQRPATAAAAAAAFTARLLTVPCPACSAGPQQPCDMPPVGRGREPRHHHLRRAAVVPSHRPDTTPQDIA